MRIPLDPGGATPVYRQLEAWLRAAIADGTLAPGTRLPSSRGLASELGIGRVTVDSAYAELGRDGLVTGRVGSGTYVAEPLGPRRAGDDREGPGTRPGWQQQVAATVVAARPAPPELSPRPGLLSFNGAGDLRLVDTSALAATYRDVLRRDRAGALDYGLPPAGHPGLRATIARLLTSQGLHVDAERILVTNGSQQGLALACQALASRGDTVLVERPTYDGALDLFHTLGLRVVDVPTDHRGMVVEELGPLLERHRPRLVYTVPTFANPTGASLSVARRRRLLELVVEHDVPLVEDDYAGDLRLDGRALPAVKALDRDGHVVHLGTFSKLLVPGLRLGYVVADGPVLARLTQLKRAQDLMTSPVAQHVVDRFVTVGRYQARLRRTVRTCRQRLDALMAALDHHLPRAEARRPDGGLFVWVRLPDLPPGVTTRDLLAAALAEGVSFTPGDRFFVDPADGAQHLRLNLAVLEPEEIDEGVRRLARATSHPQG
ncbi:MAG: PLP-dependent aminotransferase family protein [Nocardioidaceae bacterium]